MKQTGQDKESITSEQDVDPVITESIIEEAKTPKYSNTVRVSYTEKDFTVDFGHITQVTQTEYHVDIVSRITVAPETVKDVILSLFSAGVDYDKEFGGKLGFLLKDKE